MEPAPTLVDATTFYPPHVGGVEAYAAALHRELLRRNPTLRVVVLTSARGASTGVEQRQERLTVVRYPAIEPVESFAIGRPGSLARALRRADVDAPRAVLTHTRFYPASRAGGRLARAHGARWLHIEHGATFVQAGGRAVRTVARAWDHTLGAATLRGADEVLAVSESAGRFVRELSGRAVHMARRGFALPNDAWRPEAAEPRSIVYVGRLVDAKGVRVLLEAHAALADDVRLHMVGGGPERELLERQATRLGTSNRIEWHGSVAPTEVAGLLRRASVFVNPSYTEGLPTTVLEAAALGMPIVATAVGGTHEILADGAAGRLVAPRSAKELTDALRGLLEDQAGSQELGRRARDHVAQRFSWDATAALVERLAGL